MDIRKLQRAIVDGLEDVKAQNILVFHTEALSPLFERVIIASGTSNRQTKALAASVRETVKARGMPVLSTEGEDNGEWIIVDCGAAVAHIMQPSIREYYRLEEIWGGRKVTLKAQGPAAAKSAPATKAGASATKAGAPATKAAAPARKASPAAKKATAPAKKATAPAKKTSSPARKTSGPAKNAGAPASKAGAPARKAAAPRRSGPAR